MGLFNTNNLGLFLLLVGGVISDVTVQVNAVDCSGKLVKTVSGRSETCDGFTTSESFHLWPIGGDASDCHGWKATAVQDGRVHFNSANNILCSVTEDGITKITYDQYPGTIDCSSDRFRSKEYVLSECNQGFPRVLYDIGVNLDCCSNPTGESCTGSYTGIPAIVGPNTKDQEIFWNGEMCDSPKCDDPGSCGDPHFKVRHPCPIEATRTSLPCS